MGTSCSEDQWKRKPAVHDQRFRKECLVNLVPVTIEQLISSGLRYKPPWSLEVSKGEGDRGRLDNGGQIQIHRRAVF